MVPLYRRILLKLSGEYLQGQTSFGIDVKAVSQLVDILRKLLVAKVEVALVVGGGNFLRGAAFSERGLDRISCDHMGMLATVINGLAVESMLNAASIPTRVFSAMTIAGAVETYDYQVVRQALDRGEATILVGGTGNPLVSTDSAAGLRAIELHADVVLKATKVDGVYAEDPKGNPTLKPYRQISFDEAIQRGLKVMDLSAFCLCRDYHMPIRVFNMDDPENLYRVVFDPNIGTLVTG